MRLSRGDRDNLLKLEMDAHLFKPEGEVDLEKVQWAASLIQMKTLFQSKYKAESEKHYLLVQADQGKNHLQNGTTL